ncbi:MAG: hypothetical protein WAW86_01725 [Gammaproteobacteria bacterium]
MDKINLLAFLLPLFFLSFWGVVGYAALSILRSQRHTFQNILLAPSVGIAVTLVAAFLLNRANLPVGTFAIPLTVTLLISSVAIFFWRKPIFPLRRYYLFVAIFFLGLCLVGAPLLEFGFNWISYGNSDMTFYCLGAQRLLQHGFYQLPDINEILRGRDYTQYWWFIYVVDMHRFGSELMLAMVSRIFGYSPYQIYMPLIVGLNLALISTTGAMIYQSQRWYRAALITCFLLACSALTALGTLYQLIAQVGGLTLLISACILLLQPFSTHKKYNAIRQSILISLVALALLIDYPEVGPFLLLSFILYLSISLFKGWRPGSLFWRTMIFSVIISLIVFNIYWINIYEFTIRSALTQIGTATSKATELFPYFLVPSGMANLWGLVPIPLTYSEPWQFLYLIAGIILCLITIFIVFAQTSKRYPAAIMTFVMIIFTIDLFRHNSGFGLFKIAMYVQPFLIGVIVVGVIALTKQRKIVGKALLFLFVLLNLYSQHYYIKCSYGDIGSSFVELPLASQSHIYDEMASLAKLDASNNMVGLDIVNIVPAHILGLYLQHKDTAFFSDNFYNKHNINSKSILKKLMPGLFVHNYDEKLNILADQVIFPLNDPHLEVKFVKPRTQLTNNNLLIISPPVQDVFNRRKYIDKNHLKYIVKRVSEVSNHVIFVNSSVGQHYYHNAGHVSVYGIEKDYFYSKQSMGGIGRYLLIQVVNPTKGARLEINFTNTLNGNGDTNLPKPVVIGASRLSFPIMGRGSARIFSPPIISPQYIANNPYLMIDMGRDGKSFSVERHGLMKLYGANVSFDDRKLIGFARDISMVSAREYQEMQAPINLSYFPADLNNPNLEYSGIYEDGWISEDAFFNLTNPAKRSELIIKGILPDNYMDSPAVSIYIDGKKIASQQVLTPAFVINIPVNVDQGRRRVELHFTKSVSLPGVDQRPVAAKIEFLGFKILNDKKGLF